jgi:AcrR family transcriptional regulator
MDQVFPEGPSRNQRRRLQILEEAIHLYARIGYDGATFERLAERCGVSRPLIIHYFNDRDELFGVVVKYVRATFQELAVNALMKGATPLEKLEAYVHATFEWKEKLPDHVKTWTIFLNSCAIDEKKKALHSRVTSMGHERVMALLEAGNAARQFAATDLPTDAKLIQSVIAGALLTLSTETETAACAKLRERTLALVLEIAGAKKTKG